MSMNNGSLLANLMGEEEKGGSGDLDLEEEDGNPALYDTD